MHSHKTHRQHVEDAILGIKSLASHEERMEAYSLLNAEISARTLDALEYILDEIEDLGEHGEHEHGEHGHGEHEHAADETPIAPTDP